MKWCVAGSYGELKPLQPLHVVDTTGAGDAFTSGILHHLADISAQQKTPDQIVRFAAACGSLVCCGAGAIDPQPDVNKVQSFLNS